MAIHSSTIAWKIPRTDKPGSPTVHEVAKSQTRLSDFTCEKGALAGYLLFHTYIFWLASSATHSQNSSHQMEFV